MAGRLLPTLGELRYLQALRLDGNAFYGTLPPDFGAGNASAAPFPQLAQLHLASNNLSGPLPESWAAGPSFPSLVELHLVSF